MQLHPKETAGEHSQCLWWCTPAPSVCRASGGLWGRLAAVESLAGFDVVTCRLLLSSKHYPVYSLNVASMWLKLGRLYMGLENKAAGEKALRKVCVGPEAGCPVRFTSQVPLCPGGPVAMPSWGAFSRWRRTIAEPCTWSNPGPSGWEST